LRLPELDAAALSCRFPVADSQVIQGVLTNNDDDDDGQVFNDRNDDFKIDSDDEREDENTQGELGRRRKFDNDPPNL
tara:strand:+ start:72 stop:302 length:231 start_codon:yes stop_codon:yes gene_type:complete